MSHHHRSHQRDREMPDLTETKAHIFVAGHELLKAAEGVLKFCKAYVEESSKERPQPHLVQFFSKAINVAGELGTSMIKGAPFKEMMERVTKPLCETMEKEMREVRRETPPKKKKTAKRKRK